MTDQFTKPKKDSAISMSELLEFFRFLHPVVMEIEAELFTRQDDVFLDDQDALHRFLTYCVEERMDPETRNMVGRMFLADFEKFMGWKGGAE